MKHCIDCNKPQSMDPEWPMARQPDGKLNPRNRCRACYKIYSRQYMQAARAANPDKFKSYQLKRRYGVDPGLFTQLLEQQDHKCAICRTEQNETFHLDHCHTTGAVRGLLCRACNTGIGNLRDDPVIVAKALAYLTKM